MTFRNTKTKKSTTKKYRCVVKPEKQAPVVDETTKISDVKQNTFTKFTVTMSKALEKVSASNFKMVRDNDNQVVPVKAATLDSTDKTKVELEVYLSLTDAKTYTVTYIADDEAKTESTHQVTVTDGKVAEVGLTPTEIPVNKETLIEYQTLDANGVIISQKGAASQAEHNIDVKWDDTLGTMDKDTSKYILYKEGDVAEFTVTYHTYVYENGVEVGAITKTFKVTAVKGDPVISQYRYTAAKNQPYDWSKVTDNHRIALGDTDGELRHAFFKITDANGKDVTRTCGYYVESSDNSIVVADGDVTDAKLEPVNTGSAYLMIKDGDGKVVSTLDISVGAKRKLASLELSKSAVSIVSSAAFNSNVTTAAICENVDITAKDQYGDKFNNPSINVNYKQTGTDVADLSFFNDAKSIRVEGNKGTAPRKGTGYYIIQASDAAGNTATAQLRVNSIEPTSASTYSVVFVEDDNDGGKNTDLKVVSSVDTSISENTKFAKLKKQKITAVIVEKKNGVVVGTCDDPNLGISSVRVVKSDDTVFLSAVSKAGAEVVSSAAIKDTVANNVTGPSVSTANANLEISVRDTGTTTNGGNAVWKYLDAGKYLVKYELVNSRNESFQADATLTVEDTQAPVNALVKTTEVGNAAQGQIGSILVDGKEKYVEYYYGSIKFDIGDYRLAAPKAPAAACPFITNLGDIDYTITNGSKNAYVKSVMLEVKIGEQDFWTVVKAPVKQTFITTGQWWN